MADRDTELAREYGKISNTLNKEVEGGWYLIRRSISTRHWVHLVENDTDQIALIEYDRRGYEITPVSIFRKE